MSSPPRAAARSPEVLFREDFSRERSWFRFVDDYGSGRVIDGKYRMRVGQDGSWLYSTSTTWPGFDDTTTEVSVTLIEADDHVQAAIVCRGVEEYTWYEAGLSTDGVAFIDHVRDGEVETLATAPAKPLTPGETVRLELSCEGSRPGSFSLDIDGRTVVRASPPTSLSGGFMALAVSANGAATVDFADVVVRRP